MQYGETECAQCVARTASGYVCPVYATAGRRKDAKAIYKLRQYNTKEDV